MSTFCTFSNGFFQKWTYINELDANEQIYIVSTLKKLEIIEKFKLNWIL